VKLAAPIFASVVLLTCTFGCAGSTRIPASRTSSAAPIVADTLMDATALHVMAIVLQDLRDSMASGCGACDMPVFLGDVAFEKDVQRALPVRWRDSMTTSLGWAGACIRAHETHCSSDSAYVVVEIDVPVWRATDTAAVSVDRTWVFAGRRARWVNLDIYSFEILVCAQGGLHVCRRTRTSASTAIGPRS
jgi:hypothetical protein